VPRITVVLLQWFDASAAVEFGEQMAAEVARIVPLDAGQAKRKSVAKQLDKFRRAITHASDLKAQGRLNIYKKARCANTLRWALIDKGYPKPFVEEVVRLVLTRL
jgi:hypothetical protein